LTLCLFAAQAIAQSLLDGTSFQASTYNLPDSVGIVRLVDTAGSNCRSESGTPVGNDSPLDGCLSEDAGTPPVTMTFGAGPQTIGELTVIPTVTPFAGVDANDPIIATNLTSQVSVPMATWSTSGDLIELTMRTTDNTYPATVEDDFWGFAATGMQYPNADPASEVGFFRDEELGTHNNFFFWLENAAGPVAKGYDIFLNVGLGVGRHPTDSSRDVVYIFYSQGEVDENTDTLAGGSLDFYSHGSDLSADPNVGNLFFLSDAVGIDATTITGFGFGMLVQPPEIGNVPGDFDDDGVLTAMDIDLLSGQVGEPDLNYDLNGDGAVTNADRVFWVETLAGTFFGDANLNGSVEFDDFVSLSNGFGTLGGWGSGDFDGSGDVRFDDFVMLSANYGNARGGALPQPVPEPATATLATIGGMVILMRGARQRRGTQAR
jgi:hypothetical protein